MLPLCGTIFWFLQITPVMHYFPLLACCYAVAIFYAIVRHLYDVITDHMTSYNVLHNLWMNGWMIYLTKTKNNVHAENWMKYLACCLESFRFLGILTPNQLPRYFIQISALTCFWLKPQLVSGSWWWDPWIWSQPNISWVHSINERFGWDPKKGISWIKIHPLTGFYFYPVMCCLLLYFHYNCLFSS